MLLKPKKDEDISEIVLIKEEPSDIQEIIDLSQTPDDPKIPISISDLKFKTFSLETQAYDQIISSFFIINTSITLLHYKIISFVI